MQIFNELPTAFVWYDKKEKQQRYKENAQRAPDYKLISPHRSLLPFQFLSPETLGKPLKWELYGPCDEVLDITVNKNQLKAVTTEEGMHVYYLGGIMDFRPAPAVNPTLGLKPGAYYSVITFTGGKQFFSEVFTVEKDLTRYMKIEFWADTDMTPLMYKQTGWKQVVYLDTFIHVSEPEIEQDGERDKDDELIPTFQKMKVKSRFSVVVPDYMKIAITSMQMHENVIVTTGTRTGQIDRLTTSATVASGGAYSTVDVLMEQLIMTKTSCEEEIAITNANPWGV